MGSTSTSRVLNYSDSNNNGVISRIVPSRSNVNTISDVDIVQVHVDLGMRDSLLEEKREKVMRVGNNNVNTANGYNNSIESKLRRSHHVGIPGEEANTTESLVTLQNQYHDEWTIS